MTIYEMFGRQAEEYQGALEQWKLSLSLLSQLKSGAVKMCDLTVTEIGWRVEECGACKDESNV